MGEQKRPSAYLSISLAVLALVVYYLLRARALDPDGLGYAGLVKTSDFRQMLLPGHLLYGPVMWVFWKAAALVFHSISAERAMLYADVALGALGVGVFVQSLRLLRISSFAAVVAGLGLAFSYAYWVQANDVQTYAISTLFLIIAFYILCSALFDGRKAPIYLLALVVALAALFHQSNVLFIPCAAIGVAFMDPGRRLLSSAAKFIAASIAVMLICYAAFGALAAGSASPGRVAKWALVSDHGYAPHFEAVNVARSVYGLANAVVYMDNVGTSIKGKVADVSAADVSARGIDRFAAKSAFVLALCLIAAAGLVRNKVMADSKNKWAVWICAAWAAPYAIFALYYFPADHNRWVLILPAAWTVFALALPNPSALMRFAVAGGTAVLCLSNLVSAVYPSHLGTSNTYYMEARELAPHLEATDLVVFWGHDHIGTPGYLRQMQRKDAWNVFDLVRRLGKRNGLRRLRAMVTLAESRDQRVLVVGLYGRAADASDYCSEAHELGIKRSQVIRALDGFEVREMPVESAACGSSVCRLLSYDQAQGPPRLQRKLD